MLRTRVASAIRQHRILQPGERVLVAVSGGPDSLALLSLLRSLIPSMPLHLTVAHFDHAWRPESESDARFVEATARSWGYATVMGRAEPDLPHTEAAARRARYAFLRGAASRTTSSAIALGHTRDDQVETLLLHLLRGSGSRGLAGMGYRTNDLARPLLDVDRAAIERYLQAEGLTPRRDPSNDDPRFARNRIRQIVLPAIDAFNPAARRLLAQTATILGEEDRLLEQQVDELAATAADAHDALQALPLAIQRRLLRRRHGPDGFEATESRRRADHQAAPGGVSSGHLVVTSCQCDPAAFKARDPVGHLDADRVQPPLRVGTRNPGDRMQPLGMVTAKRLQDILVDAHVPRLMRDRLPIVSDREEIVWIPSVTVAEGKRVTRLTQHQLHLEIAPL
ncbi:MAG: tRNA lysidine(34) synthetase TilS [Candidatus Dormibacteraeota bacterium]|nr:tRNA lysidine(34) synthetase TilS [Candidatus Dormibacteraeota bacterium]